MGAIGLRELGATGLRELGATGLREFGCYRVKGFLSSEHHKVGTNRAKGYRVNVYTSSAT